MTTLGSCTVAQTPTGDGQLMIQRRIENKSWAEIAQEFGLKSPGAARARFTKLTGITDYKIKGVQLKQLVDKDLLDTIKVNAVKTADKVVKKLDDAVPDKPITPFSPQPAAVDKGSMTWKQFKASAHEAVDDKAVKVIPNAVEDVAKKQAAQLTVSKAKYLEDAKAVVQKYDYKGPTWYVQVKNAHEGGKGYSAIVQATGKSFEEVDEYIWNMLLKKHDGNPFLAIMEKKNSEKGIAFIKEKVANMKAAGWSSDDIYKNWGFQKYQFDVDNIVDPIKPSPHMYTAHSPSSSPSYSYNAPTPPQHKVHYQEGTGSAGYSRPSKMELDNWHNSLPKMDDAAYQATKSYTGSGYHAVNSALRNGFPGTKQSMIDAMDRAMVPAPKDMQLIRHVGPDAFKGDISTMGGTVYSDPGYLSTSISDTVFRNTVRLELDVPAGTPGRWAMPFSQHSSEQEYILGRGLKWLITSVEETVGQYGGKQWVIKMKVIG